MSMWEENGKIKIDVTNVPEFNALLKQAEIESYQLQETLKRLANFTLDFEFKCGMVKQE